MRRSWGMQLLVSAKVFFEVAKGNYFLAKDLAKVYVYMISRRGENRASVLSVFEKNIVFAIAKLLTFISKILEFCRAKSSGFKIMACKSQGFLCWKLARFFSLSAAHAFVQHATSFLQNIFFGVHPTPLPNPDASHQFRIDMAVHPGRKATGNRWFRQFPHWIHSTCVNQHRFVFNFFLMQKIPLEWLHASCRQPNLALKDL